MNESNPNPLDLTWLSQCYPMTLDSGRFGFEAYFFSGSQWVLWDMKQEEVLQGPFDMADHHAFNPLLKSLDLCSGEDLNVSSTTE